MPEIPFNFNPIFREVNESKKRYVVMKGSAGSGKSVNVAQNYIAKLISEPGRNLVCIRKSVKSNRMSTFAELVGAINRAGLRPYFPSITTSPLGIKCINGNKVMFAGVNDENQREALKSITVENGKLTDCWIEEATELQQSDFGIINDRFRGELPKGQYYQIILTFNPVSATHWIKKDFFDKPDKNTLTHHSTYRDNRFIDAAYYESMERKKIMDPEGYEIYGLGNWGEVAGLIFNNWKIIDVPRGKDGQVDFDYYDDLSRGQDFGFNHANAILDLGIKDNNIFVSQELYVKEKDTDEIIQLAEGRFNKKTIMFCDAAEPDRIQMWRRAGYTSVGCTKGAGSVKAQIDWLQQRHIFIDSECPDTYKEISQYRWKKDPVTGLYLDEPVVVMDDAMAALRYGVQNWRTAGGYEGKEIKPEKNYLQKDRERRLNGKKLKARRRYF